jgi:hypothetical protein
MTSNVQALFMGSPTSTPETGWADVDEQGRLVLLPEAAARLGIARAHKCGWSLRATA